MRIFTAAVNAITIVLAGLAGLELINKLGVVQGLLVAALGFALYFVMIRIVMNIRERWEPEFDGIEGVYVAKISRVGNRIYTSTPKGLNGRTTARRKV